MAEQSFDTRRMTRDQERRIAAATAIGLNAVKPILQFQVSLLRLWADNIEKFAQRNLAARSNKRRSSNARLDW